MVAWGRLVMGGIQWFPLPVGSEVLGLGGAVFLRVQAG